MSVTRGVKRSDVADDVVLDISAPAAAANNVVVDITGAAALDDPAIANIAGQTLDRKDEGALETERVVTLVRRGQEGDRDAFGELYRMHQAAIYRFARHKLGAASDDAVAETFLRAWRALPRYRDRGVPFIAWLYGIARHVVADELRARQRAEPRDQLPDSAESEDNDAHILITDAIAHLPKPQRQVIEMKYLLGMGNEEIAAVLKTSTGAVNAKRWRAIRRLSKALEDREA